MAKEKTIKTIENGPMLAVQAGDIPFPVYASSKLDGLRCFVRDGMAMSRSNIPLPNEFVQEFFDESLEGLDGELIVGEPTAKDVFNKTQSAIMRQEGQPDFTYYIFDCYNAPADRGFEERLNTLRLGLELLPAHKRNRIQLLPQTLLTDFDQLVEYEQANVDAGYEGTMIRKQHGGYKFGRSTAKEGHLLKLKRFVDSEAEVIGVQEFMHNANEAFVGEVGQTKRSSHQENLVPMDTLGALLVRDVVTGIEFGIGTGFSNAERDRLWSMRKELVGNKTIVVSYKYFEIGVKEKPRFPVYKGLRHRSDMS
jgi:DNA ligase 1